MALATLLSVAKHSKKYPLVYYLLMYIVHIQTVEISEEMLQCDHPQNKQAQSGCQSCEPSSAVWCVTEWVVFQYADIKDS